MVRTTTMSASPENSTRSGDTSSTCRAAQPSPPAALRLGEHRLDAADVEERLLGHVVELAVDEQLETLDRLVDRHEDARQTGEDLGHEERLGQEPLDLAGPGDRDLSSSESSSRPRMAMMSCSSL